MSSQLSTAGRATTRRLAAALALAAVVTLGVSVAAPTDAASAASTSTSTYSVQGGASSADAGSVATSDRQQPTGRLYIAPRFFDNSYAGGVYGAANDVCSSYHLGKQCFNSLVNLFRSDIARQDDCQVHGADAVIPYIQYTRCRKS